MFSLEERTTFNIEALIRRSQQASITRQYNADLQRLLPWPGKVETLRPISEFGVILVTVRAGEEVDAHNHDEEE